MTQPAAGRGEEAVYSSLKTFTFEHCIRNRRLIPVPKKAKLEGAPGSPGVVVVGCPSEKYPTLLGGGG